MDTGPVEALQIRQRLEALEEGLSPHAARSSRSLGRQVPEEPSPLRTEYQRDRDRIIHTNAFRRLKHKTQVFLAPSGDHYVTRLTHTLEVAQVGRTIARALNLNEDLVEAMCYGHDLGHTPFGHLGEETLDQVYPQGFTHSAHSLRIVELLAKDGEGLNLTAEVRQGIISHSKPRGDFLDIKLEESLTLEAQILRLADSVAYLNHDIADAVRAGMLKVEDLPQQANQVLGATHAERANSLITAIVQESWPASGLAEEQVGGKPVIGMDPEARDAMMELREYMFQNIYLPLGKTKQSEVGREVVKLLYHHFVENAEEIPPPYFTPGRDPERASVDYVAGMTDHYAIRQAERLQPGITQDAFHDMPLD
ncbi:MAG TPA: deoxyguanosinetriphosphate triphosphohydrolase [Dehalococcoidia bacterium]|nr:deoxyguanosinetriphosphate triphosphohydrolase [Chloroflexota bacterium]MQF96366.1 deoxyguanosinetriphosphate triphosphohydrolase [SAR202 cluster bacterium]HAA94444.1 deoxyguanosinetriphosphate triphosphohydrolase [Dehalococcoidia bacterium]HCL25034.1 deoxyguanosinetriphosphate triphosphohydrolase [Dehalococcoidia bacterium]|tara:strand:- start:5141 stop:6238 length:1098 start_codon:yes stop_codon:yes gene_type:complete